jgi:hypothetical protein
MTNRHSTGLAIDDQVAGDNPVKDTVQTIGHGGACSATKLNICQQGYLAEA